MEPSLEFLLRHAATLFPGVPIVFASIDASSTTGKTLPGNVTGVLGMGLAISRSIIENHNGRIWATLNPDRGLTVHIELPSSRETRSDGRATVEVS